MGASRRDPAGYVRHVNRGAGVAAAIGGVATASDYSTAHHHLTRGTHGATRRLCGGFITRSPATAGCPEERTCIPPGPPFDQGCAVTSERLFKVLPPDPQRLDHDGDRIGCEPIGAST